MDYPARQKKIREHLAAARVDFLLANHLPSIRYLCGFTGSAGFLLVEDSRCTFFTDVRYDTQAHNEVQDAKVVIARKNVLQAVGEWIRLRNRGRRRQLGIETDHLSVAERERLADIIPSGTKLKNTQGMVEKVRMVKDEDELERIRAAVQMGAGLFGRALETIRPGIREVEVAAEMEYAARIAGAEGMSFPTIIASGERSALPHGRASTHAIPPRAFVVCDFGVILADYCSDQTRSVWVGHATDEARNAYEAVREAQQAAVESVRPGATVEQVDRAARTVLRKAGLGSYFTHSTGHGVGLEIHEAPRVATGQKDVLQPGMVITIEPGIYFPGKWGIRIEDMVAVTQTGCEIMTPTSKSFLAV
ncbi:MAG TPA: aminopeptidase P family protein [Candidatus Sulfotelmatobacter sp.]|nr:aminopeptidase P family protein [Candidatus Sulfotelmatobacter sp.]